jgi:hypothetical protein
MTNAALLEVFDSLKCGDKVRIAFSGGFACTGKEPITVKVGRKSYSKKYKTHKIRLGKVDRSFGLFLYKRAPSYWKRVQSEEDQISLGHGDLGCVLYYLEKVMILKDKDITYQCTTSAGHKYLEIPLQSPPSKKLFDAEYKKLEAEFEQAPLTVIYNGETYYKDGWSSGQHNSRGCNVSYKTKSKDTTACWQKWG